MARRKTPQISWSIRPVYKVEFPNGKKRSANTLYGAAVKLAQYLVNVQYSKRKRCKCGRKDKFCEYHGDKDACGLKKTLRIRRVAKRLYRSIRTEMETYGKGYTRTVDKYLNSRDVSEQTAVAIATAKLSEFKWPRDRD